MKKRSPRVLLEVSGREKDVVLFAVSMSTNGLYFKWNVTLIVMSEICTSKIDTLLKRLFYFESKPFKNPVLILFLHEHLHPWELWQVVLKGYFVWFLNETQGCF